MAHCENPAEKVKPGDGEQQFVCGICMENYKTPRYLPTCGHTFCEHCLFTYATNIQQQLEQGSKQECPVCRKPYNVPPDSELTLEWAQTLPLNTAIVKMIPSTQETKTEIGETQRGCDPCNDRGEPATGVKFCVDCQETFCQTCIENHQSFKALKNHTLMDATKMSTIASHSEFFSSFTKCTDHPEKELEFYCEFHDFAVCATCIATGDHKLCDIVEISGKGPDSEKLGKKAEKLVLQMRAALDHLAMLQNIRKETQNSLKTKLREIREAAEQAREQVVRLMDDVVNHVTAVTKQIEVTNEDRLHENTSRLSKLKEIAMEKLGLLDAIENQGSKRHKIICAHSLKIEFEDIDLQIFEEDECMRKIDAELKIADDISKLIARNDIENLVQVEVHESDIVHKYYDGVSNYLKDWQLVRVEGKHLVRPNADNNPWFEGVATLENGRVVLSDKYGHLCLYNFESRTVLKLKLNKPWGATAIDGTHIAVSIPSDKVICIVKIGDELTLEKTIKTQNIPKSIVTLGNGHLAVSWDNPPAFSILDISGRQIVQTLHMDQDKCGRKFKSFRYVAVDEKRQHVIQPCREDTAVYCFDYAGEPVFRYTDPGLRAPRGVALDKCGNIYVCESVARSVHKLSPSGQQISIMTDGIPSEPRVICSDGSGKGFWMTQTSCKDNILYFKLASNLDT